MADKLFVPIILGTVRQGRYSEKVAHFVYEHVKDHSEFDTQIIDIRDMNLPMTDEGEDLGPQNEKFRELIKRADGYIIVTPEYNRGIPGSLKRALDIFYGEYNHKAVGAIGVSEGYIGGARAVEMLLHVMTGVQMFMVKPQLYFPMVKELFDENGQMSPENEKDYKRRIDKFLPELIWASKTLKYGRENIK